MTLQVRLLPVALTARSTERNQEMDKPLIYLASPYSHLDAEIREERARLARVARVELMRHGTLVYAPIALASKEEATLPHSWDFWHGPSIGMLSRCDAILVYMLNGWSDSVGMRAEIRYAHESYMPILYWEPEFLTAEKIAEQCERVPRRTIGAESWRSEPGGTKLESNELPASIAGQTTAESTGSGKA